MNHKTFKFIKINLSFIFFYLCHIFVTCYGLNNMKLTGAVNSSISIPCPVFKPNDSIDLILWFKDKQESAIFSLDARSSSIEKAKQNLIDKSFLNRAFVDISNKQSALMINNLTKKDSNSYTCRIDFRKGRTQYKTVQLNIIDEPKDVVIMDSDGQSLDGLIGPYNENGHLILICETDVTDPPTKLFWYKDKELIDDTFEETQHQTIRNELTVLRLTRDNLLNNFTCEATNSNLTQIKRASVTLELNLRPLSVKIKGPKESVSSGSKIDLYCQSKGARPNATISWWIREENYEDNNVDKTSFFKKINVKESWISSHSVNSDHESKLDVLVDKSYINKKIVCRADHPILPESGIEDVYTFRVNYSPKASLTLGSNSANEQVYEKSNVTFICHVNSNPPPSSILWFFNKEPIHKSNFIYISNHTELLLQNVDQNHNGNFSCMASNIEGDGFSEEINLKINYSPICVPHQKTEFGVTTYETTPIKCMINSYPPAHTIYWTFNSTSHTKIINLYNFKNYVKDNILTSTLNYSARNQFGFGKLSCSAVNIVGRQKEPCYFNVNPGSLPEKLNNCVILNQNFSSLLINCEPGNDGGMEQKFFLEVYRSGTGKLMKKLSSLDKPIFEVEGLPRSTMFVLILYSANAKGKSDTTTFISSTLPLPNKELVIITPLIAVLIGIIGSLAITAISIVVISKIKNSQKKVDKYSNHDNSNRNQNESFEEFSGINYSDVVFNSQTIDLKFNTNNNFNTINCDSSNEYFTNLDLIKENSESCILPDFKAEAIPNRRYIMVTSQKNKTNLNDNTITLNQGSVNDQSPLNFLLFQS